MQMPPIQFGEIYKTSVKRDGAFQRVQTAVARTAGRINFLVHPFFSLEHIYVDRPTDRVQDFFKEFVRFSRFETYQRNLQELLTADRFPLFIGIAQDEINATYQRLAGLDCGASEKVVVPTIYKHPQPHKSCVGNSLDPWRTFFQIMRSLGVHHLQVFGELFYLDARDGSEKGCVSGFVLSAERQGLDTSVYLPATYPNLDMAHVIPRERKPEYFRILDDADRSWDERFRNNE
jgi:hypothetical protein